MKRNLLKIGAFGLLMIGSVSHGFAQSEMADFVKGGISDAEKLLTAYASPFGESFGANLNAGWVNTAAPLKPGRFELKLVANVAFIPTGAKTYNLTELGFASPVNRTINGSPAIEQWQYGQAEVPTLFGSQDDAGTLIKTLTYEDPLTGQMITEEVAELPVPTGIGLSFNPIAPAPQLSVGLPFGTEIMGRYLPGFSTASGDTETSFSGIWGIGFKHDIKQWIPGIKQLPFSMSLAFGYSSSTANLGLAPMLPEAPAGEQFADPSLAGTAYAGPGMADADYTGQGISFRANAWNVNLLVSKKVSVFSAYGGLRYARAMTTLSLDGVYGVADEPFFNELNVNDPNNGRYTLINTDENPITLEMPLSQVGLVGGFRLKLGFLSLFAEGTYSKFSTVSAGMGFGWMN